MKLLLNLCCLVFLSSCSSTERAYDLVLEGKFEPEVDLTFAQSIPFEVPNCRIVVTQVSGIQGEQKIHLTIYSDRVDPRQAEIHEVVFTQFLDERAALDREANQVSLWR